AGEPSVNPSDGSKISKNKKITKKPLTNDDNNACSKFNCKFASVEPVTVPSIDNSEQPSTSKSAENSHETVQVRILWQDKNPCELPASAGTPGGVARKMWHFDESLMSCVPFVFLGSGGNANRFSDPESCMRTCGSGRPTRASCDLPSQFGNGTFKIPRYYFD
ncbi:Kunitz/Bovine pancreatic trypsin inhibitor domain protein, partial [Ostertagia ostertagi]